MPYCIGDLKGDSKLENYPICAPVESSKKSARTPCLTSRQTLSPKPCRGHDYTANSCPKPYSLKTRTLLRSTLNPKPGHSCSSPTSCKTDKGLQTNKNPNRSIYLIEALLKPYIPLEKTPNSPPVVSFNPRSPNCRNPKPYTLNPKPETLNPKP